MTKKPKTTLEKLKEQRDKLTTKIQAAEGRFKVLERKQETRRKILVGSYYLDQAHKQNQMQDLKSLMDKYLTRNSDRKLFELPELQKASASK